MSYRSYSATVAVLALLTAPAAAQVSSPMDSATLAAFEWRPVGPANMGGRVTDIEGIPSPSKTFFVAFSLGGIWKTTNAGTTFRPVFDRERVISMGDLAIAPSDTMVVWAGTGEEDSRNSIAPGGGIYKSTDGGLTWTLMGLKETQQIGRIVIHPTNPDIVYVAALGHVWGPNRERGLYKTTDGGKTWQLSKFVSDKAGFVDVAMDPRNPNVLYASSWERVRGPYFLNSGGPGSALWKTTDAGKTWTKISGGGFPTTMLGRVGIAIAPSNPDVVYALVEADSAKGESELQSGLYRSADAGKTWTKMNNVNTRPFYYSQVRVDPENPDRVYWSSTPVQFSDDGGKTVRQATLGIHVDHHAMWIDPKDGAHFMVGDDGGLSQTWDRGGNYEVLNVFPAGQFYEVSYNMDVPYRVCGGLQDNGAWCGPSRLARGGIDNHYWFTVNGGDGFYTQQDPTDPDVVYAESQGGSMARINLATGERSGLQKPNWRQAWMQYEDSIIIDWPDTTQRPSGSLKRHLDDLRARQRADSMALDLRWNWNTPFLISSHDPHTFYAGANRVMKSTKRGDDMYPISPDLTVNDPQKVKVSTETTGGVTADVTGAETYATIVALAESPVRPGLLFAGTDDGNTWMTRNDGGNWENLTGRFPGVPKYTYVVRIEPSHQDSMTVYVAFDGHRTNDFTPYLYVSNDMGKTFRSIANNLPTGSPDFLHVVREDPYNPNLLFVGTDVGAYVSTDRGQSWQRFMAGLPTVPVHDLQIHPRDHELIAATHGRSVWIVDITPLEQLTDKVLAEGAYLFAPKTAYQFNDPFVGGESVGHQWYEAPSASYGAQIAYSVGRGEMASAGADNGGSDGQQNTPDGSNGQNGRRAQVGQQGRQRAQAQIVITDVMGDTLQTLQGPATPGIHTVYWNFRGKTPPREPLSPAARRDSILQARRVEQVFDSLKAEGTMPAPMLDRLKENMLSGNTQGLFRAFGGGGGGFGGQRSGEFNERPGESAEAGGRGGRGGGGGAAGAFGPENREQLMTIMRALRRPGQRGFGGRGGQAPLVETGDYLVTLTIGDTTMRRVLRVEKLISGEGSGFFGEDEWEF